MEKYNNQEHDPKAILEEVAEKLKVIRNSAYDSHNDDFDGFLNIHKMITDKLQEIENKYPNFRDYKMYHVIASSTSDPNKPSTKFDFPEQDSLADFIRSL